MSIIKSEQDVKPVIRPLEFDDLRSVFSKDMLDALQTNTPAPDAALRSASAIRGDPDSFVAMTLKRKTQIRREIHKLELEHQKLSDEARVRFTLKAACDTISAPIRRVPLDIIREIIHFAVDEHPSPSWNASPMTLARVSSAWRTAVLTSHRMWSTLYLTIKSLDQDSIIRYTRTVKQWFARTSVSAPKSFFLYVDLPSIAPGAQSNGLKLFLKAIGPSLSGLYHLGIGSHDWARLMAHFANVEWDVSKLEKFDILGQVSTQDIRSLTALASINEQITLLKDAKRLTTLTATQEIRDFMPSFTFIPWSQLTDISILENRTKNSYFNHTLRTCTKLSKARLTCVNLGVLDGAAPIVHENLTQLNLRLGISTPDEMMRLFSNCIFTNLNKLRISVHKMYPTPEGINDEFDINAFPSLEYLKIHDDFRMPKDMLLSLLRGTPKLKGLSLYVADSDGWNTDLTGVLDALTLKEGDENILPLLEECSFYGFPDTPNAKFLLDASVVGRFVDSRSRNLRPGCSPLRQVAIGGCFRFLTDIEDEVDTLSPGTNPVDIYISEDDEALPSFSCESIRFEAPFSLRFSNLVGHTKTI